MTEFLILFTSLFLVAVSSAAETSFVAADKVSLVVAQREPTESPGRLRFNALFFFLRDNQSFFATIVVASNLFVTLFSSVAELFFHEQMGIEMSAVFPVATFIGFFFGELIPKSAALESPESSARYLLPAVMLFHLAAQPLVKFTANISNYIVAHLAPSVFNSSTHSTIFERRDVYRFLGRTVSSGYLDKIESEIIRKLITNANMPVKNFSVPRTQIVAVKLGTGIDKLREVFEKNGKTKVLVFDSSLDNIVGVVHAKDIFMEVERVDQLISDVLFVPENITIKDLLEEFKAEKVYVAILIDEFGGTSGLVTSSDIMEVFLGDFVPRVRVHTPGTESMEDKLKQLNGRQFIVHGTLEINELEKRLRIKLPKGDFASVAGLVISKLGRIPSVGERVYINGHEFQVLESDGRKLESLKLTL